MKTLLTSGCTNQRGAGHKLSNQRKVVIEGDSETQVTHATGRKRHAGK
ncbi:30S ribosomal protein subunit S22 family protein [Enterobacter sp. RC4]|nr:30S ribosomal protein subunit S22 family protein [Enterobacter sp. RC4]KYQ75561.1 30S ribosomal protein S22 [Enterobacter sp. SENG-6]PPV39002.1 30S ribosomal protein S22 [Enterobacter sp. RC4]